MTSPAGSVRARRSSRASVRHGAFGARTAAAVVLLLGVVLASPAHAAWIVPGLGGSMSGATTLASTAAPTAVAGDGTATVSWSAAAIVGTSVNASGYVVERIWRGSEPGPAGQLDGDVEPAPGGCAGTVTDLSCTTTLAAGEVWAYRVAPRFASWSALPSPESSAVQLAAAPEVTAIALFDAGTPGVVEAGDRIVITFSEILDASSICSAFSDSATGVQTATGMTFTFIGNPNDVTVDVAGTCGASGFGSLQVGDTGNGRYTQGGQSLTTPDSTLAWDPSSRTITVTFGSVAGTTTTGASAIVVLTPGALTAGGLPIDPAPVSSATAQQF